MSGKTTAAPRKRSTSGKRVSSPKRKRTGTPATGKKAGRAATARTTKRTPSRRSTPAAAKRSPRSGPLPTDVLARAESDIGKVMSSLNQQMNAAMSALTELAVAQCNNGESVVRTAPLDRATATFKRLVSEVVEDQLADMLPPLVALRHELAQRGAVDGPTEDSDFYLRGTEMLDQVLASANATSFEARRGEHFDPLIHLAVGETRRNDLAAGVVAESLQSGFRTARGKVIAPAKVKVNRR